MRLKYILCYYCYKILNYVCPENYEIKIYKEFLYFIKNDDFCGLINFLRENKNEAKVFDILMDIMKSNDCPDSVKKLIKNEVL